MTVSAVACALAACSSGYAVTSADKNDGASDAELTPSQTATDAGVSADASGAVSSAPLSAYFGANDVPPMGGLANCPNLSATTRYDGVPVVFPTDVDPTSFSTDSFAITRLGMVHKPVCATLLPATSSYSASAGYVMYDANQIESFENRTILLVFDALALLANSDLPVAILKDVLSEDHQTRYPTGATAPLITYGTGPSIQFARRMDPSELPVATTSSTTTAPPTVASLCPYGTTSGVLIVWQGGVTVNGAELTVSDMDAGYKMTVENPDGSTTTRVPDGLGDTGGDGDNNQIICLVGPGTITNVSVLAHTVTDPSKYWNPATSIAIP